jgi:hypothetical protein
MKKSGKSRSRFLPFAGPMQLERTKDDLFIVLDGVRIARRGHPGTPQAETWVSMGVPGFEFVDMEREKVEVKRYGKRLN